LEYSIDDILSNDNTGSDADDLLTFAYGRSIVQGPGSDDNLRADDTFWVEAWKNLIALPSSLYKVLDSSLGKGITQVLTTELRNVRLLKNVSEKLIVLVLVILHRVRGITSYSDICRHISRQLNRWEAREYDLLVQTTLKTLNFQLSLITKNKTEEEHFRAFHQKVLRGNLKGAVRYLTDRVGGAVLSPDDAIGDGQTVRDALLEKHPEGGIPPKTSFQDFKAMPLFVSVTVTAKHVDGVAKKLRGSYGLGGLDANNLSQLLLRYKDTSEGLRHDTRNSRCG